MVLIIFQILLQILIIKFQALYLVKQLLHTFLRVFMNIEEDFLDHIQLNLRIDIIIHEVFTLIAACYFLEVYAHFVEI